MINKEWDVIRRFCRCYVNSRDNLINRNMPEGKKEPEAPYCLLPYTWQDYAAWSQEPSIASVESCHGKKCDLKEALGLSE
jgi:hypothetical protein